MGRHFKTSCVLRVDFPKIFHISHNEIYQIYFHFSQKKTLLFLLLVSIEVSVQIFTLGLAVLFIFGWAFGQI